MSSLVTDNLPLIATAPDGLGRLRNLIRLLAVSGRLLPTDKCSWERMTLADVGRWGSGGTPLRTRSEYYGGSIPWLVIGDLNDGLVTSAGTSITEEGLANSSAKLVPPGTVLIAMYGSIGKLGITGIECATNQAIAHCKVDGKRISAQYLFIYLKAIQPALINAGQGLAQQNISQKTLKGQEISLPPLPEQHRIVARVDELMALCDRLETEQADAAEAHARLVDALLATLAASRDAAECAANWQRLAEHFDTLFTTEASIDALKQTILQLAVMGRLVPQDPGGRETLKIEDFCEVRGGLQKTPHRTPRHSHFPYLRVANVQRNAITTDVLERFELTADELERWRLQKGDLLIVEGNGSENEIGRCAIWQGQIDPCVYQNHLIRVRPQARADVSYMQLYLNSPEGIETMKRLAITTSGLYNLSVGKIRGIEVPLPPLPEQHRIVAKVDELMALCDRLKADLATAREHRARLADTLVQAALEAA